MDIEKIPEVSGSPLPLYLKVPGQAEDNLRKDRESVRRDAPSSRVLAPGWEACRGPGSTAPARGPGADMTPQVPFSTENRFQLSGGVQQHFQPKPRNFLKE